MKVRRILAALAVSAALAGGTALAAGGAAQATPTPASPPTGASVTATEAYSDSLSDITALFNTPNQSAVGTNVQVPAPGTIQFGAVSSLNVFPGISWTSSPAALPTGFSFTTAGLLTIPLYTVTTPVTFTVWAAELSPGLAKALAFVTVTPGNTAGDDSVTIATDTVALNAPSNEGGAVTFTTTPSGVPETAFDLPAGVVFNGVAQTLTGGTAVPGNYPLFVVHAADPAGAVATEGLTAVIRYTYAAVPKLSDGHAVQGSSASRENVYFVQSGAASCDHFTIVGPGAINGHQGWVPAVLGLNAAVYGGLEAHHGYTVYYTPVDGPADCSTHSTTPWPGSHFGYVYFVS